MHDEKTPELHKKHRERVRNRFLNEGLSTFEDHEVLELLLFYAIPQKMVIFVKVSQTFVK